MDIIQQQLCSPSSQEVALDKSDLIFDSVKNVTEWLQVHKEDFKLQYQALIHGLIA